MTSLTLMRPAALSAALAALALIAAPAAATEQPAAPGGPLLAGPGLVVDAPVGDPLPEVRAESWLLADLETGDVLAAKNAHLPLRPASTLKILTALTLLPELDPAATYTAQWEDANVEGSKVGIVPDATYTVHNLFEALFLVSGNDAALALGNAAGGVDETVARMNQMAKELGAHGTRAVNPSGLDAPGQRSTAYDLAVLARAAMEREDFRAYAATVKSQFPADMPKKNKKRKSFEIYTQDRLLLNYRGAIGIKTGWTTKARGTFVGAATRGGRTLVATVMRTDSEPWRQSAALLTWGFRNAQGATPVGTLNTSGDAGALPTGSGAAARQALATSEEAAAAGSAGTMPWWVQAPLALLAVVVVLRMRVLIRRRRRTVRHAQYARTLAARAQR